MPTSPRCPNCEAEIVGLFCSNCGQRQSGRLQLGQLGADFVAQFLSTERGWLKTLVEMTLRPGRTARNYIAGQRKRYVNPFMWYVLCAAVQFLALFIVRDEVSAIIVGSLPDSYFEMLRSNGVHEPEEWAAERYFLAVQNVYTWFGLFAFVLPMALVLRLLIWRRHNLAEALIVSLHSVGHVMMLTAITAQVMVHISVVWHAIVSYSLYAVYAVLTVLGCYGRSWWYGVAGFIAVAVGGVCFYLSLGQVVIYVLTTGF